MDTSKNWKTVSLLVCVFAMVREIRPIEPFFTSFLRSINFTLDQINEEIYAVGTYSCLVLAVVIFLITDYFRYKPLIIADGIAGILTYALLLGTPSLYRVQMEQVFFGFFYSSEVAFTTYLYAKVDDKQYYQKITSLVKASMLFGRFLSGFIAQTIVSTHLLNEVYLLYFSIFSTSFVTLWSLILPKVEHSLYFHRNKELTLNNKLQQPIGVIIDDNISNNVPRTSKLNKFKEVKQMLFDDFQSAYKNTYVVKKCFWWIVAVVGHIIVATYIQVLWEDVNQNKKELMNGAVESIHTLCGAAGAYAVGHLSYDWKKFGDIIFTAGTFVLALLLFIIYYCNSLWILYVLYISYGTCYQVLLTITTYIIIYTVKTVYNDTGCNDMPILENWMQMCNDLKLKVPAKLLYCISEVAKYIKPDSYGLIFGFNLFMSLLIISIFTLLFIQGLVVVIGTKNQILTVSLMFTLMSTLFCVSAVKTWKK